MASSAQRMVHQDYIARIRFSNALPPPPIPPKLLDMPNTGLASGQYTTPGFASRLAREQPLNIEADAELGMPLDLVGMPGIFEGDESSIQAPSNPPPIHPHDRALLRPLASLGRPKVGGHGVSFLRRTEYISSSAQKRLSASTPRSGSGALLAKNKTSDKTTTGKLKRGAPSEEQAERDSPVAIRRRIDEGFQTTARLLSDPSRIRHPSKRNVKLVEALPVLPDLDAFPDSGAYVTVKFLTAPMPGSTVYDNRLVTSLFRPLEKSAAEEAAHTAALEAHLIDPANNPKPQNLMNYDFYLGQTPADARQMREKLDVDNPRRDDVDLYTVRDNPDGPCFQFSRLRAYETAGEVEFDHSAKYDDELIWSVNDDDNDATGRAVLYYPVMQRTAIRPQRTKNIARKAGYLDPDGEEQVVDQLDVSIEDPPQLVKDNMAWFKATPRRGLEVAESGFDADEPTAAVAHDDDDDDDVDEEMDADGEMDAVHEARTRLSSPDDADSDQE